MRNAIVLCNLLLAASAPSLMAAEAETVADALRDGTPILDLHYRYESVDQSNFAEDAQAHTLRARAGYRTGDWRGIYLLGEVEATVDLEGDYNNTDNGKTTFPTVADPDGAEINQAFIGYRPNDALDFRLGLQRIQLGNLRYISNVAFRQREQTYLAFSGRYAADGLEVNFGQIERAQRVFGADHSVPALAETNLDAQFLDVAQRFGDMRLMGYYYAIGNDDTPAASHADLGLAFTGRHGDAERNFNWRVEVARQDGIRGGASTIDADYSYLVLGYHWDRYDLSIAQEVLGGDGVYGFQTPLATLHAFNGWTDQFLTTPAAGLRDRYLSMGGKFGKVAVLLVLHDFAADSGGADLGSEWGVQVGMPVADDIRLTLKYADYTGTATRPDVAKIWVMLGYAL